MSQKSHLTVSRGFFLLLSAVTLVLFWKIIEPFAVVLLTAAIFTIILSPIDNVLRRFIRNRHLSALLILLMVLFIVLIPVFILGVLVVQQASDIVNAGVGSSGWLTNFSFASHPWFLALPQFAQEHILAINFAEAGTSIASWVFNNIDNLLSNGVRLLFHTFIFFISLYYFLIDRHHIREQVLELSPFKDKIDENILTRIVMTVRTVMLGALVVAIAQASLAIVGLSIFGVPGALLWGSLIVVAAQIPLFGPGLILVPSVVYLAATGHPGAAIGLAIWSVVAVGSVDNILSPLFIGSRTKLPEILVLISVLGGLQFFGPIGFIVGPTVLAAVMVLVELYKAGILEKTLK